MRESVFVLLGSCAVVLVAACAPRNEFVPPPPPGVTVQKPAVQDVTTYTKFTGQLEAKDTVEVRARVRGFLKSMEFKSGGRVEKDQLLFTIEPEEYQAAVDAANGSLAKAQANLELAGVTAKKYEDLYSRKAVSEMEVLTARAEETVAAADVKQAEATVENAELNLSYTKIFSPIPGRASRDLVSVGNLVGSGENTLLTTIVLDDPMYAYFKINERDILRALHSRDAARAAKEAPPVTLELADGSRYGQQGKIDYVDNEADAATGMIEVRAVFSNPKSELLSGLFAKVLFPRENTGAILVPDAAIQRDLGGQYVLVVDNENIVEQRYIETGDLVEEGRIVTQGLSADESIIVSGLQRARPGIKVSPTTRDESAAKEGE